MRTVIFLGLLAIADAIREDWLTEEGIPLAGWVLVGAIVMDVVDFLRHRKNEQTNTKISTNTFPYNSFSFCS